MTHTSRSRLRIGRLGFKDIKQLETCLPQQTSMLASYCLQVAIVNNPSLASIANLPETRRLQYWIQRGLLCDVQYRFLVFDHWVLDQIFWARLPGDFYIGYVRLPKIFDQKTLTMRYDCIFSALITLAKSQHSSTVSTQLVNPVFINMFKAKAFKAVSPEGVGLPVTFQLNLHG